ncbi:hypothetical protein ACP6PL_03905 [Dapis sp. BLCC M126]
MKSAAPLQQATVRQDNAARYECGLFRHESFAERKRNYQLLGKALYLIFQ